MGSGSSTKVQKMDKGNQMPPVTDKRSVPKQSASPALTRSHEPLFVRAPHKSGKRPPSEQEDVFELDSNIEEYSKIWDRDTKLTSSFQQSSKSGVHKLEPHQKETFDTKWEKTNHTNNDLARVESKIDAQTHACINLSSSEKIDELVNSINNVNTQLDKIIRSRTEKISSETESIHTQILYETQQKQQRLLAYAKSRQIKQDEHYGKLLKDYISQLDEIRANELAELQKQLQAHREEIMEESQLKIMTVNEQANLIKTKVIKDEQQQAAERIDSVMMQIQRLSADERGQHLGSELITKTNVITNANVGIKASGQHFSFKNDDSPENDSTGKRPQSHKKK